MEKLQQMRFEGERALFQAEDVQIRSSTFLNGESPLKESRNIRVLDSTFQWKYPLWYAKEILLRNTSFLVNARAGVWYSEGIQCTDSFIQAPKTFRKSKNIDLENVSLPNAEETLWDCERVSLVNVTANGNYFGMNSRNITADNLNLSGDYCFDSAKNVEVRHSRLLSKDAFWNCENVTVYDSVIIGEYLGWNSKNLRFVNCIMESLQGFCYIENLVIENSQLLNTPLAFEYSTVDVQVTSRIDSVKNPISGIIRAESIGELILEESRVNPGDTTVMTKDCVQMARCLRCVNE